MARGRGGTSHLQGKFLEELKASDGIFTPLSLRSLVDSLRTREELTQLVVCTGGKYDLAWLGLKTPEGSDYLAAKELCALPRLLLECLLALKIDRTGLQAPLVCEGAWSGAQVLP